MPCVSLLERAMTLHRQGFVPVPLRRGGKHLDLAAMGYPPHHLRTLGKRLKELAFTALCYHFSQKPPDESMIGAWFGDFDGNIGVLGGYRDLAILDFDDADRFRTWETENRDIAERSPIASTPGGRHVFVRIPQPLVSSSMYRGARRIGHIKALGGYVVVCPSRLNDEGRYDWLDGHSLDDFEPLTVESLARCGVSPVSPLKRFYDRQRKRGSFEPQ